ncbi:neuropeptide Y receptor type 5 [Aedes albopictus]|uniref:G-protein coupled receptors family 1 profile domain-containing protein n=1 Tax=Aedes albopictus TaxID=7160 RepID=A0ABM1YUE6_AEDAL
MAFEISEEAFQLLSSSNFTAANFQDLDASPREQLIGYWENSLKNLSTEQRTVFTVLVILVMVLAIFGNVVTFITNIRREQRHLFRVCLLSLALSDILFVTITSIVYLSQFNTEYNSLWTLGELMCTFAPFFQTMAVLVDSITLVAIALDRYMAVVRLNKGAWEPSGVLCVACAVLIWGLAAGVSSPMLTLYQIYTVIVLIADRTHSDVITGYFLAQICATDKSKNGYYFGIVFTVIFLPLLLSFLWLNTVIAKEIWIRRNPINDRSKETKKSKNRNSTNSTCERKTTSTNISSSNVSDRRPPSLPVRHTSTYSVSKCVCSNCVDQHSPPQVPPPPPPTSPASSNRKKRQLRMFKAIVFIMSVFFLCRLPTWIFLLIKLHGTANTNIFWTLHYTFGLMAMLNCVLNPLIYTFLGETIKVTVFLKTMCERFFVDPCRRGAKQVRTKFSEHVHSGKGDVTLRVGKKRPHQQQRQHDGMFCGD